MLAMRLANRRPELDQSQFPEYVDEQIPTQRTNPAPARVNGGNARRPNNQQLHDRLGIQYPPYATTPESRSGRNLQDEDARGASRRNWDPRQRSPRRSHGFVSQDQQRGNQIKFPTIIIIMTDMSQSNRMCTP